MKCHELWHTRRRMNIGELLDQKWFQGESSQGEGLRVKVFVVLTFYLLPLTFIL